MVGLKNIQEIENFDALPKNIQDFLQENNKRNSFIVEAFTRLYAEEQLEAADWLRAHEAQLVDKVIVCDDISQGLVPMDPVDRAWREMNGRALLYLAGIAESVERVFCGIPQRLK